MTVAGVSGHGRTDDEKVPRAWVVLSAAGRKKDRESKAKGEQGVVDALDEWQKESLSKYKWTRGGIEIVKEVSILRFLILDSVFGIISYFALHVHNGCADVSLCDFSDTQITYREGFTSDIGR